MDKILLSEKRINDIFENGEALTWAKNVYSGVALSEEEKAFSEAMNDVVAKAWKYGNTQAKEEIAEVVLKIIEPEIFQAPTELLNEMFTFNSHGEFDKIEVKGSYKNTLVAHESAARTGNFLESWIN